MWRLYYRATRDEHGGYRAQRANTGIDNCRPCGAFSATSRIGNVRWQSVALGRRLLKHLRGVRAPNTVVRSFGSPSSVRFSLSPSVLVSCSLVVASRRADFRDLLSVRSSISPSSSPREQVIVVNRAVKIIFESSIQGVQQKTTSYARPISHEVHIRPARSASRFVLSAT